MRFLLPLLLAAPAGVFAADWPLRLAPEVTRIESETPGEIGVFVKNLADGKTYAHQADRPWYLASTTKVLVAVALMKEVEKGSIRLDQEIILRESDFVDGSGDLIWMKPGRKLRVSVLLEKMLVQSDSTATDMLIRLIGEKKLNQKHPEITKGFGPITTLLRVRQDAFSELHPRAATLSNMDFIRFKKVPPEDRPAQVAGALKIKSGELKTRSLEEAFERYYRRGKNSAPLGVFADLLERLAKGELLGPSSTALILGHMEKATTGEKRLKAGLPGGLNFSQKTGTQIQRACNVGIVHPPRMQAKGVVVTTCAESFGGLEKAERAFAEIGRALARSGAFGPDLSRP